MFEFAENLTKFIIWLAVSIISILFFLMDKLYNALEIVIKLIYALIKGLIRELREDREEAES